MTCDNGCGLLGSKMPKDVEEWYFEGLIIVEKLEHTSVCGTLCKLKGAYCSRKWKVSRSVVEIIEIFTSFGTV